MSRTRATKIFGYPDIHIPNQDSIAFAVAKKAHEIFKPDKTVIGGDLADCSPFSRWSPKTFKEGEHGNWLETIAEVNEFLNFCEANTKELTYWIPGNHDMWPERWAVGHGATGYSIYSSISLKLNTVKHRNTVVWVDDGYLDLHDKLVVVHGWSTCMHAARKHLELAKTKSIIFNHTHRRQMDTIPDPWDGTPYEGLSAGCLCTRQPIWRHDGSPSKWSHGFWVAYIGKTSFTIYPIPIWGNKAILPNGKIVKV